MRCVKKKNGVATEVRKFVAKFRDSKVKFWKPQPRTADMQQISEILNLCLEKQIIKVTYRINNRPLRRAAKKYLSVLSFAGLTIYRV